MAECTYGDRRLIVRRTRLTGTAQRRLWPDWRHFGFLTDLAGDVVVIDQFHRDHATVELAIRDLKEGAGMNHVPSGDFNANSAWLQCAVLAHNLIRWTATLGPPGPVDRLTVTRTLRVWSAAYRRSLRPRARLKDQLDLAGGQLAGLRVKSVLRGSAGGRCSPGRRSGR